MSGNKNDIEAVIYLVDANSGIVIEQDASICGVSPMANGALTVDSFTIDGKMETNIYASGVWNRIKMVGDVPAPRPSKEIQDQIKQQLESKQGA